MDFSRQPFMDFRRQPFSYPPVPLLSQLSQVSEE